MLWEKESARKNALYINICADSEHELRDCAPNIFQPNRVKQLMKSNKSSADYRNKGNQKFKAKKWLDAIESYNQSLSLAEVGSQNVGMAFANRSSCFYQMEKYEQCLVDIELAKKSNYPRNLMFKLDEREANCKKFIASAQQPLGTNEPKLSFDANNNSSNVSELAVMKFNEKYGRHFVALRDIEVGEKVMTDEFFVSSAQIDKYTRCSYCSKQGRNLVACRRCTNALFCHDGCENNGAHKSECGLGIIDVNSIGSYYFMVFRSIFMAVSMFENVNELMSFVEKAVSCESIAITGKSDAKSKYCEFLKLSFDEHKVDTAPTYAVYKALFNNFGFGKTFDSKKYKRFLMHMVHHHARILDDNMQNLISTTSDEKVCYVSTMAAYLNHSCAPNVMLYDRSNMSICIAVRPIKKNEQLFVSYFENYLDQPFPTRQTRLKKEYGFKCDCERCESPMGLEYPNSRNVIAFSPDYEIVKKEFTSFNGMVRAFNEPQVLESLKAKCITLLKKHGRKNWSKELGLIVGCFMSLAYIEYCNKPLKWADDEEDDYDDDEDDEDYPFIF